MSSTYEALTVDVADHIAQVTLIGPGKGNAMGPAFWAELPVVFAELDAGPDVRAIVLTGSGRNFTYGLDLAAMGGTLAGVMGGDGATAKPRADFHKHLKSMQQSITAVADCRTPTIAAVHGWCIGGGVDLISAVDIRYASADAKFSVREVKLQKVDPPEAVIDAFRDVQRARADLERQRNEAEAYANDIIPRARGDSERVLQEAHAYKQQTVAEAEGEAARFLSIYVEYALSKDVTVKRIYIETMQQIFAGMNKVIIDDSAGSGVVPYLPLPELRRGSQGAQ